MRGLRIAVFLLTIGGAALAESRFGVLASGDNAARPEIVGYVTDLGAGWVRINLQLDGKDQDPKLFLDAGVNVILTMTNRDPANVDTTYGTLAQYGNAGFPYRSKSAYQKRIRDVLNPLLASPATGRQVWVQCENEVGDASVSPDGRYWRGTTDQYLTQLAALYEAVKAAGAEIPVALSGFASENLDVALDPSNPRNSYQTSRLTTLLGTGQYDAADLHFYGCVEDIPSKAQWVKTRLPVGKRWISTENGGPDSRCPATPITYDQSPTQFEQLEAQQVPSRLNACASAGGSICLWFSLLDLRGETSVFNHLGLLDSYVTPARKKPAYAAFQNLAKASLVVTASAASYLNGSLAPDSIATTTGASLATARQSAAGLPLPASLAGTSVKVRDSGGVERAAPLYYVSPAQVNWVVPAGTSTGTAALTITGGDGTVSTGTVPIVAVAPGLFSANGDGQGVAAANVIHLGADGSRRVSLAAQVDAVQNKWVPLPIEFGPGERVFLILYGSGIRRAGSLAQVSVKIGGVDAPVSYAGAQAEWPGLDQVNVELPSALGGRGGVNISLSAGGVAANVVTVSVR